ncbi:DNA polymerase III subunit gamma/tau [Synechococcus sp. CS-1325]|uniref:DNA polymerase III subunit gamma/tau n=1 Tax=unclassified Synechococcus TaxID=2626047 RepID=UPI000DB2912B|nr:MULTISPECIES: DNA polymerase III subunit gamma/tau [unclassified Synechococcus]MCT0199125.1 DNA polymerase III subunit gamma/tau [Synechococcus sp. CS-1325]MCT0214696.1 DNA polymerase III subunit gamma/tau [Synechococcus sp. CS-1326]MCT0234030.1 DNA polymerase III subunit gamma/tau [Synechococcus sp. CS-1327]PZV01920.1 MAG: DNA polymerase III subunit gamma/tau [Cyanobium sp.]
MSEAPAYQPLHLKYRPQRFDQLVGQEAIAATLSNALLQNRIAPAYLFSGPRGTGKTSSARILARSLNCVDSDRPTAQPCGVCELCRSIAAGNALDVIEIDAASNTGVDNIRELIERSRFAPVQARWKVYVIDECHMLSTAAFNALLKTLEEPPPRVVFVLATTDPQRVLPTILSRCQRFDFRRIPQAAIEGHLRFIATEERIEISQEALQMVAQRAQGGLRDAESLLDQLSLLPPPIETSAIWELLGAVPEQELLHLAAGLASGDPLVLIEACRLLLDRGREPSAVLQGLASLLRDLVLAAAAPGRLELSSLSPQFRPELPELAERLGNGRLLRWQSQLRGSEQQLRHSIQPRLWLEVLLLGLLSEPASSGTARSGMESPPGKPERLEPVAVAVAREVEVRSPETPPPPATGTPTTATPAEPPAQNLPELWQQILSLLTLPSTRMLLSQQASLVRLDDQRAVVRVSGNWMPMVQSRQPLLEQALQSALGSPRQLVLEPQEASPQPPEPTSQPVPATRAPQPAARPQPVPVPAGPPPAPSSEATASGAPLPGQSLPRQSPPGQPLAEKAQRLAEFFNGEVVDLEEPEAEAGSSEN